MLTVRDARYRHRDLQRRVKSIIKLLTCIAALSRPYRCAAPFHVPSMRAISKTGLRVGEKPGGESRKYDGPAPQSGGAV